MAIYDTVAFPRRAAEFGGAKAVKLTCFALCVGHVVFLLAMFERGLWLIEPGGNGIPVDFLNVWAAGRLVLDGLPAAAYDWPLHKQLELTAVGNRFDVYFPWSYPPFFLFVAAPLALLPYSLALVGWESLTLSAYVVTIRRIVGHRVGALLACAFPAVLVNFAVGQNGFLTAALLGGTLTTMQRRPMLAGCLLGLMTYKPQYGILFPIVLVAGRAWRTFWTAAVVAALLAVTSLAAFDVGPWEGFLRNLETLNLTVLGGSEWDFHKLQSTFGLARSLGAGTGLAWTLQAALTAAAALLLWPIWRGKLPFELKAAAISAAALLATPYIFIYDLVALAVPMAFLLRAGRCGGFLSYELPAIAGAGLSVLMFPFVEAPVGFAAVLAVAALIARRIIAAAADRVRTQDRSFPLRAEPDRGPQPSPAAPCAPVSCVSETRPAPPSACTGVIASSSDTLM